MYVCYFNKAINENIKNYNLLNINFYKAIVLLRVYLRYKIPILFLIVYIEKNHKGSLPESLGRILFHILLNV